MTRLFSAIRVPAPVEDWLSDLEQEMPGATWIDPDDYHLTVRFFGDVDRHVRADLVAGLEATFLPAFRIQIKGLAVFGGDRPRALVADIEPSAALTELHRAHERIAQSAGLEPEHRKFSPHITLARLNGTLPETVARFIQSLTPASLPSFAAEEVELMSARPGSGGGPYIMEEAFRLSGAYDGGNDETGSLD
jgi:RNA 2',3'-cyclic 3'-phosphodiesterase